MEASQVEDSTLLEEKKQSVDDVNSILEKVDRETLENQLKETIALIKGEIEKRKNTPTSLPLFPQLKTKIPNYIFQLVNEYEQEKGSSTIPLSPIPDTESDKSDKQSVHPVFESVDDAEKMSSPVYNLSRKQVKEIMELVLTQVVSEPEESPIISHSSGSTKALQFTSISEKEETVEKQACKDPSEYTYLLDPRGILRDVTSSLWKVRNVKEEVKEEEVKEEEVKEEEVKEELGAIGTEGEEMEITPEEETNEMEEESKGLENLTENSNTNLTAGGFEFVDGYEFVSNILSDHVIPYEICEDTCNLKSIKEDIMHERITTWSALHTPLTSLIDSLRKRIHEKKRYSVREIEDYEANMKTIQDYINNEMKEELGTEDALNQSEDSYSNSESTKGEKPKKKKKSEENGDEKSSEVRRSSRKRKSSQKALFEYESSDDDFKKSKSKRSKTG